MSSPGSTRFFLNVDLEVESSGDLMALVRALEPLTCVLERPAGRASFELLKPVSPTDPEPLIRKFARMVHDLPPAAKNAWNQASRRVFDIGIQSCPGPPPQETYRLTPETLRAAADIGAEIAITIYALIPEDET